MPKTSAGLLIHRQGPRGTEVLLIHPGGPLWAKKDLGAWSIPKGELEPGEDALAAARREFEEETGFRADGEAHPLGSVVQKNGKLVHAWAVRGDFDSAQMKSSTFTLEWPPKSGTLREFPEADRAAWFSLEEAAAKIVAAQALFLRRLQDHLGA